MKEKLIKIEIILLIAIFIVSFINSAEIQETYEILEPHFYRNIFASYVLQNSLNDCNIHQGPNCYFISKIPDNDLFQDFDGKKEIYYLYYYTQKLVEDYKKKGISTQKYLHELKLIIEITFETFNKKALSDEPYYYPRENKFNLEPGKIEFLVLGKLRLKNLKEEPIINPKSKSEPPKNTFGLTETDVQFKSKQFFILKYLYIRCADNDKESKIVQIISYKDNKSVYKLEKYLNCNEDKKWVKVKGRKKEQIDSFVIPRGIEVDNLKLVFEDDTITEEELEKEFSKYYNEEGKLKTKVIKAVEEMEKTPGAQTQKTVLIDQAN